MNLRVFTYKMVLIVPIYTPASAFCALNVQPWASQVRILSLDSFACVMEPLETKQTSVLP